MSASGGISGTLASIGRTSLFTLGVAVLVLIIRFVKNIVISRVLEPEFRGVWGLLNVIPDVLVSVGLFGLGASITYHVGKGKLSAGQALGAVLGASLLLGLPLGLAAGGLIDRGVFWNREEGGLLAPYLPVIVAIIPFFCLRLLGNAFLLGSGRIAQLNLCRLFESLCPLLLFLAFLFPLGFGSLDAAVYGWFWAMIAASLVPLLLLPAGAYPPRMPGAALPGLAGFGLRDHPGAVLHLLCLRANMLFIAVLLPPAQLGYYVVAVSIAELLCVIPESVVLPFTSAMFRSRDADARELNHSVLRCYFWLMLPVCGLALLGLWPFVRIFFGKAYLPAVACAMALVPGMFFLGLFYLLKIHFANQARPGIVSLVLALSSACCLPLGYLVTREYGIVASAGSASLSYAVSACGLLLLYMREHKLGLKALFIFRPEETALLGNFFFTRILRRPRVMER